MGDAPWVAVMFSYGLITHYKFGEKPFDGMFRLGIKIAYLANFHSLLALLPTPTFGLMLSYIFKTSTKVAFSEICALDHLLF